MAASFLSNAAFLKGCVMKPSHLLVAVCISLSMVPAVGHAQRASFDALRDSLAAVRDVPQLYRMERGTEPPGAARTIDPLVRRGLIALRIYQLTDDRADAHRARDVFDAAVQRFPNDPLSHYALAYA